MSGGLADVELVEQMDRQSGVYLLRSRSSMHVFDLDAGAYLRLPGERSNTFPHDVAVLRLTRVERWPEVHGDPFFIWVDDPREYAAMDYWRQSSAISAMYRLPGGCAEGVDITESPVDGPASASAMFRDHGDAGPAGQAQASSSPEPAQDELIPGLRVRLGGRWTVLTSLSDPLVSEDGVELFRPGVLEWPLRRHDGWQTLLSVYRVVSGGGMRLRLDVRHGDEAGPRSTSSITCLRLAYGSPLGGPARRARPGGGGIAR